MTDPTGLDVDTAALFAGDAPPPTLPTIDDTRVCPDCDITEADLPGGATLAMRVGAHRSRVHGYVGRRASGTPRRRPGRPKGSGARPRPPGPDKPPASLTVNVGGGKPRPAKTDPVLEAVERRINAAGKAVASLLVLAGRNDATGRLIADGRDIEAGRAEVAAALADLAEYEPWLKALGKGEAGSERMMAWVQALMAIGALALPILLRHEALPAALVELLGMGMAAAAVPAGEAAPGEPVAA